jgi:putative membrane protein
MINLAKKRDYTPLIIVLSVSITLLITLAFYAPAPKSLQQFDLSFLPLLNAVMNAGTFIALLVALWAIKNKKTLLHRNSILLALSFTGVFLVSYLVYHFSTEPTSFLGVGAIRNIYFFILISHIVLAVVSVPLALVSVARGLNMSVARHRSIARWTMPIWLYVSLTGVITYILIAPYYK